MLRPVPVAAARDAVTLDAYEHDFGDVESLASVTHEFRLTNGGQRPIEITGTRSTCGCSSAEGLKGLSVAPGEWIPVPVTIKVAEDEFQQVGDVTVLYSVPGRAAPGGVTVRVTASPRPDYRILPRSRHVDFGRVETGETVTRSIELQPLLDPNARFVSAETTDTRVGVTLAADGRSAEIRATAPPGSRSGDIAAVVVLKTNNARQPRCAIYTQGECKPLVEVAPRAVTVASGQEGLYECELAIDSAIDTLVVRSATVTDVRVTAKVVAGGGKPRVRLSIPEGGATPIAAELNLVVADTARAREFRISVPVVRLGASR